MQRWYVIYTKARQEQVAAEQLKRQGFTVYLPVIEERKRQRGKWRTLISPLFPRYLFIYVDVEKTSIAPVCSTVGVSKLVRFGNILCHVPAELISYLQNRENQLHVIQVDCPGFSQGDRVEIIEGPFAGLRAVFQKAKSADRVVILLELLGRVSNLTLSKDQLIPAA